MVQECLNCIELRKEIDVLKNKVFELEHWKGKDKIIISKDGDEWTIIDHEKDKHSGKVKTTKHYVPNSDVIFIKNLLHKFYLDGKKKVKAGEVWDGIILAKNLPISDSNAFSGRKNRNKYYFPIYYFPIKILEHLKIIKYGGRGTITLIDKYFEVD